MGIEVSYRRVTPQEFDRLLKNVDCAIEYFGYGLNTEEDIEAYFKSLETSDRYLDLGQSWRSLYSLFTDDFICDRQEKEVVLYKIFFGGVETK
jgi:hypothetical protein